jgi:hypothetical protein
MSDLERVHERRVHEPRRYHVGRRLSDQRRWLLSQWCTQQSGQPVGESVSNEGFGGLKDSYLLNEFEQLTFSGAGVSQKQDVDISPQSHSIGEDLFRTTEEQTSNGFFDIYLWN